MSNTGKTHCHLDDALTRALSNRIAKREGNTNIDKELATTLVNKHFTGEQGTHLTAAQWILHRPKAFAELLHEFSEDLLTHGVSWEASDILDYLFNLMDMHDTSIGHNKSVKKKTPMIRYRKLPNGAGYDVVAYHSSTRPPALLGITRKEFGQKWKNAFQLRDDPQLRSRLVSVGQTNLNDVMRIAPDAVYSVSMRYNCTAGSIRRVLGFIPEPTMV